MSKVANWLCGAFALALGACTHQVGPATERMPEGFLPWQPTVADYTLRPGDQIEVKLTFNPELSDRVVIGPDGRFAMQMIGRVQAEGKTTDQLAAELKQRFSKELRDPDVAVVGREYVSQRVLIGGEVRNPGIQALPGRVGVLEGVMLAGGFRETAELTQVALIRRTPENKPMLRIIDLKAILTGAPSAEDVPMHPFDVVYVPRSSIAELGLWVEQYITRILPFDRAFNYTVNRTTTPGFTF